MSHDVDLIEVTADLIKFFFSLITSFCLDKELWSKASKMVKVTHCFQTKK